MDDEVVEVAGFEIDALPWPNDPDELPMASVSHAKAAQLCASVGKRLCHELEWELACEGTEGMVYPSGDEYDEALYQKANDVVAGSGVRAMGTIEEWTAGEFGGDTKGLIALRGAPSEGASAATRRCARRTKAEPAEAREGLGFRCCKGPEPELVYKTPTYSQPFTRLELSAEAFQEIIRSVPELKRIHDDPRQFTRDEFYQFRAKAGFGGSVTEVGAITWKALRWVPVQGEEIVVATGIDGRDTFIVALYELPSERYAHAASYVLVGDRDPIMLAYTKNPSHVGWMPCHDCSDGGYLRIDEETGLVDISQRW